ncbi:AarF/ABC1/UbiB kinase family protein, partial [archaeon]
MCLLQLKVKSLQKKDKDLYSKKLTEIGKLLTNKVLELGPTFIKLGQLLSTRIDVLPREFIDQLVLLQDQVPGFSGDVAVEIIEKELGKPIDQLFDSFNRTAIAAASLGQVHLATMNGKTVAVKIQRQGLKRLFDMDLKNIKVLAKILDKFDPKTDGAQRDWISIYDESAKLLYKEIDYQLEALNSIRFQDNFKNVPWVKVPDVYFNMTTTNVIVMEYVPGIKVNNIAAIEAAGIDRQLLAKRSAESYLTQLCRHGFFHCDPHPGNLACDAVEGGRLIYYDFGMMDELSTEVKTGLVNLVFGIYENDVMEVCDALEVMGVLKRGVDRVSIEKIVRFFLEEFASGIKPGERWTSQLSPEKQREIQKQRRLKLGADLFAVGNDVPFKFPPTLTFVFRAFTSLDGIGKGLDSKYDLTRLAQPFLKELVDLRDGSAAASMVKAWAKQLGWRPVDISNTIQQPR